MQKQTCIKIKIKQLKKQSKFFGYFAKNIIAKKKKQQQNSIERNLHNCIILCKSYVFLSMVLDSHIGF